MTNTFEENLFKQFIHGIDEEREIFSLLTDCIAQIGKEGFKIMLEQARALSRDKGYKTSTTLEKALKDISEGKEFTL